MNIVKNEYRIKEIKQNKYSGTCNTYYIIQYRKIFLNGFIKTIWCNYKSYYSIDYGRFKIGVVQKYNKFYDKEKLIEYLTELQQLEANQYLNNKIIKTAECCNNDKSYYVNLSKKYIDSVEYVGCNTCYRKYYEVGDSLDELKNIINDRINKNEIIKYINI